MVSLELLATRVTEASIKYAPPKTGAELKLENRYSMHMEFPERSRQAVATFVFEISDTGRDHLLIHVVTEGVFSADGLESGTDRKAAIAIGTEKMFPYVEGYVRNLASMSGIHNMPVLKPEVGFDDIKTLPPRRSGHVLS